MKERLGLFTPCPTCGLRIDPYRHPGGVTAHPGDTSICLRCGQLLVFAIDFIGVRLRLPTEPEMRQLLEDIRIAGAIGAWIALNGRQPSAQVAA